MSADVASLEDQPLTVKEAVAILSSLQPSQVLPVLRHSDYMMLAGLAFAGFRQDATGYTNPIVRRRLAEEAAKNPSFSKKLRDLSKQPVPLAAPLRPAQSKTGSYPVTRPDQADIDRETEKYRAERDRLKQERDAAISARQAAERVLTETKRELIAAQVAKTESDREAERSKQRLERLDRKLRQTEASNAALRRASIQPSPTQSPILDTKPALAVPTVSQSSEPIFAEAVRHLLGKQKELIAISIVSDVLRTAPEDASALEIKADALIKIGKDREAVPVLRTLIPILLKSDLFMQAAFNLSKLLRATALPAQESKSIRDFMAALPRSTERVDKVAEPLFALRSDSPAAFEVVKSLTPSAWAAQLFPEQTTFALDEPLPLVQSSIAGITLTARKLITAVERNDWPIVELTQEILNRTETDERHKILESITAAADGDKVYSQVLFPKHSRGPIVVDSSNVAWHGQEHNSQQQPRLTYVLSIRRALWQRGFFPVVLMADANFPFVINDPTTARKMVDDEQIQLVLGGSDADEHIIREAQRLGAPIVTNDYMVDWDPNQSLIKIQYTFSPDGKPTVYF